MTPPNRPVCKLSNKSPRHAITSCSGVIPFLWILQPFHLSVGIKVVSRLINLTDRVHCAQCQLKRKPYCPVSWRLTFYCSLSWQTVPSSNRRKEEYIKQMCYWTLLGTHILSAEMHSMIAQASRNQMFFSLSGSVFNVDLLHRGFPLRLVSFSQLSPWRNWSVICVNVWERTAACL